ncbi:MAG: glycosyltransferase family 4 protein [Candidatus Hodarchaeales archaeon]|jgi:glycosyltransferase involved in cell wall biosynthesis
MPIHSFEVITELAKKGHHIYLFACLNENAVYLKDWVSLNITVIKVPHLSLRIIGELAFLLCLLIKLFIHQIRCRCDLIYVRHGSISIIGSLIGKIYKTPVCIEVNDIVSKRAEFKKVNILKRIWIHIYETISFFLADKIFPVTDSISNWIKIRYQVRSNKIVTVANGVNTDRFTEGELVKCRNKFNLPQPALIIGYLGSLFNWAGLEYLIKAAPSVISAFPNVLFVIGGGEEPYLSKLQQDVAAKNLSSHIKFFGVVDWKDASDFINTFNLSVAPVFFENTESGISSQKVLAYLACGKPVIGSDIQGLGDVLDQEKVGTSFRMGDSLALSDAIIALLKDSSQLSLFGKKARKYVVEKCSWQKIVDKLENYFFFLIEEKVAVK